MRTFKCYDCEYTWKLPRGEGGRGVDLVCPECGSRNVHRLDRPRGQGLWRRGVSMRRGAAFLREPVDE